MKTITQPQSKLQKVIHLLKISNELKITKDSYFDILMDMSEKNYHYFDRFLETINSYILEKASIEDTKDVFIIFINNEFLDKVFVELVIRKLKKNCL